MTMGTASTMTSAAEVLGMTLPGAASIPAVDSGHHRLAAATGLRIVDMVWEDLTINEILTADAYADAVATVIALGGSTNAVIHLIAMARRSEIGLSLADFRPHRAANPGAGEHPAGWRVPDGGFLLRRRPSRSARANQGSAAPRPSDGHRAYARRAPGRRDRSCTARR